MRRRLDLAPVAVWILLTLALEATPARAQTFTDVTVTALPGIDTAPGRTGLMPAYTGGAAVGDCDGDGHPDLYFTGSVHDVLYRNRGDGSFEDASLAANLGYAFGTRGAAFGDVDNDGDLDLVATGAADARHFLYVNAGNCTFSEQAEVRGLALDTGAIGRSASFGDYDRDGWLDLYVTELQSELINPGIPPPVSRLFRNRGAAAPGVFDDVTLSVGLSLGGVTGTQNGTFAFAGRFTDLDHDGWPDLPIISDFSESRLFWNDGTGHFIDGTVTAGVGTDEHGMGVTSADVDGDGRLDLFVTSIYIAGHPRATGNRLYRNLGGRAFADVTDAAGVRDGSWGWGTEAFDADNDGDLDLVMTDGAGSGEDPFILPELGPIDMTPFLTDQPRLWRNDGAGVFTDIAAAAGLVDTGIGYGAVPFDYDGDGDQDILLTHEDTSPFLFRNDSPGSAHWLDVELDGRCSSRRGVGARVTVTPSGGGPAQVREVSASSTYLAQDGRGRVHFGLGSSPAVTSVSVEWPSGTVQTVTGPAIDGVLRMTEPVTCRNPGAPGGPTTQQQRCINLLHAAGTRVATAVSKNLTRCMARALAGQLPPGQTASQCLAADGDGRLARAEARTVAAEAAYCTPPPAFGPTAASAINTGFATLQQLLALFGPNLDSVLTPATGDCQLAIAKGTAKILVARLKAFTGCVKDGLREGVIVNTAGLEACYGTDPDGKIALANTKASASIGRRCAGIDLGAAIPGPCGTELLASVSGCLDATADCDACTAVNAADGTARPCHRFVAGIADPYCGTRPVQTESIARVWDEEILAAIRVDFPRPPIHARNLFHLSVAMWDAWAAYDPTADGYLFHEKHAAADPAADRTTAISFAAYRVLSQRYAVSPNAAATRAVLRARMQALGYDSDYTTEIGTGPAAIGNRIASTVLNYGYGDGANQNINYADPTYAPVNAPLVVKLPGTTMADPNRWQPLALDLQIGQNGIPIPGKIQVFVGPQWGTVASFAANLGALLPGPPPLLQDPLTDAAFKQGAVDVLRPASQLTPDDATTMDISPGAFGNNPLGTNAGTGYGVNPVTGLPYAPQVVKRGDFGRVLAEFWADGPTSETPPGHWNTLANYVSDNLAAKRIGGTGPAVDDLEWDVKLYVALNGAVHDAAVGCWGTKRLYDSVRPISMIRYMGGLGQSSDPLGDAYHPDGLPLEPGLIEVITAASSAPGERHEALAAYVGEVAVLSWPGEPASPATQYSGVRWMRAKEWVAYQRKTFVTPPFAGYTSGHSTFSRSAAEVLTAITGSPWFPGGLGEFTAPQNAYLLFEIGPSQTITLQWASYYDAADQAGQSRIWGGIHILADDFGGRIMGATIGADAWAKALTYYAGTAIP